MAGTPDGNTHSLGTGDVWGNAALGVPMKRSNKTSKYAFSHPAGWYRFLSPWLFQKYVLSVACS
jgi:hypothetical protein